MNLHLLVPSLFWPDASLPEIYRDLSLPSLETLLARGSRSEDEPGYEAWLCRTFGVAKQRDWPIAPLTLQADGGGSTHADSSDYWLRADPVHLRIERDQIMLADSQIFRISSEEADQLVALLNRHFADEFVFLPLRPDRWYLRAAKTPALQTHALGEIAGKNINDFLPSGTDNMVWHGIFNEIQMLLHEHPLNQAREARGELAINSVWFWGGGILPHSVSSPYTSIWSNDVLPRALALAGGARPAELPPDAAAWQHAATTGNHLVVLDALRGRSQYGDAHGWRESLKKLERDWFAPLLSQLKQQKLDRLTLTAIDENRAGNFAVIRGDLWKFWRTIKALPTYARA